MATETQSLIPSSSITRPKNLLNTVNEYILDTTNVFGTVTSITYIYGAVITCTNVDDNRCQNIINKISLYTGLGITSVTVLLKVLAELLKDVSARNILSNINFFISQAMKILNMNMYYLLWGNMFAKEISNSNNIPDAIFWAAIFLPVLLLTASTNTAFIRYKLREIFFKHAVNEERGDVLTLLDMMVDAIEGTATMTTTISGVSQLHDTFNGLNQHSPNSWVYSRSSKITRWVIGGIWGSIMSGISYFYPSTTDIEVITRSCIPMLLQNLLNTVTLSLLSGFAISTLDPSDRNYVISGITALSLAVLSRIVIECSRTSQKNINSIQVMTDNIPDTTETNILSTDNQSCDIETREPEIVDALPEKLTGSINIETQKITKIDQLTSTQNTFNRGKNYITKLSSHIGNSLYGDFWFKKNPHDFKNPDTKFEKLENTDREEPRIKKTFSIKN